MNAPSPRRTQTRDRIIEAALGVFAEKGVLGASVEEICDAAGFTRGAFYSNYQSKDALCLALLERLAEESLAATREAIASLAQPEAVADLSIEELIDRAVGVFIRSQRSDRAWVLASMELRLYAARTGAIRAAYRERMERECRVFAGVITEAADQVGFELLFPSQEAVNMLHAVFMDSALDALISGEDSPELRAAQLGAALQSMLRPA